jgi:23S rRNA (adenine2503-C2)-methyltransferase
VGGNIGHKNLVFSTVGDPRVFERLPQGGEARAGAVAAHHQARSCARELLPRAPRITPAELVEPADAYARATGYPVQYQWTLLDGVNDGDDEIEGIVALLSGKLRRAEPDPFNRWTACPGAPSWERAAEMARSCTAAAS